MSEEVTPLRTLHPDRTVAEAKFEVFSARYGDRPREQGAGLHPRQIPEAWVIGLKASWVKARIAKVFRNGAWRTLSLVVQFDCIYGRVNESREGFAKVLLRVDVPSGWVSIHEDSCRDCTQEVIEAWLITCPRCAAGEDLDTHPDHDYECPEDERYSFPFHLNEADESPISFVIEAMKALKRGKPSALLDARLGTKATRQVPTWTAEKAREWLDALADAVPAAAGQREAWRLVQDRAAARRSASSTRAKHCAGLEPESAWRLVSHRLALPTR